MGLSENNSSITEHGSTTVCGVFPDFIINSMADPDLRPSVFFYLPEEKFVQLKIDKPASSFIILIKVREGSEAGMKKKITDVFNLGMPQKDASVSSLEEELQNKYNTERGFRNALMAGNVVILLITLIGLLGYTTNEASRHQKELAIRKINGATMSDITEGFYFRAGIHCHSFCSCRPDWRMVYSKQMDAEFCCKSTASLVDICSVQPGNPAFSCTGCCCKLLPVRQ